MQTDMQLEQLDKYYILPFLGSLILSIVSFYSSW
jgi:hypothetical protein